MESTKEFDERFTKFFEESKFFREGQAELFAFLREQEKPMGMMFTYSKNPSWLNDDFGINGLITEFFVDDAEGTNVKLQDQIVEVQTKLYGTDSILQLIFSRYEVIFDNDRDRVRYNTDLRKLIEEYGLGFYSLGSSEMEELLIKKGIDHLKYNGRTKKRKNEK